MESKEIDLTKFGYSNIKKIGQGLSGLIYKTTINNKDVAVKVMKNSPYSNTPLYVGFAVNEVNEITILSKYQHPNIIKINRFLNFEDNLGYEMPLTEGSIADLMTNKKYDKHDNNQLIKYIFQFLDAVNFLHTNNIIHNDLHYKNILITQNNLVISDFGLSYINLGYSKRFADEMLNVGECILSLFIWSFSPEIDYSDEESEVRYYNQKIMTTYIDSIVPEDFTLIRKILYGIMLVDEDRRLTIQEAIKLVPSKYKLSNGTIIEEKQIITTINENISYAIDYMLKHFVTKSSNMNYIYNLVNLICKYANKNTDKEFYIACCCIIGSYYGLYYENINNQEEINNDLTIKYIIRIISKSQIIEHKYNDTFTKDIQEKYNNIVNSKLLSTIYNKDISDIISAYL